MRNKIPYLFPFFVKSDLYTILNMSFYHKCWLIPVLKVLMHCQWNQKPNACKLHHHCYLVCIQMSFYTFFWDGWIIEEEHDGFCIPRVAQQVQYIEELLPEVSLSAGDEEKVKRIVTHVCRSFQQFARITSIAWNIRAHLQNGSAMPFTMLFNSNCHFPIRNCSRAILATCPFHWTMKSWSSISKGSNLILKVTASWITLPLAAVMYFPFCKLGGIGYIANKLQLIFVRHC